MNVNVFPRLTRAAEGLPRRSFTVAEVEAMVQAGIMDEDERIELIGGELVPMSPKGVRHERVKLALLRHWHGVRPKDLEIAPETTFRLSSDTCLEPDIVIFPLALGIDALTPENAQLVVEIADSSKRYDMGRKAKLYASFGVRELWVIDAVKMTNRVFRAPSETGYVDKKDHGPRRTVTPVFAPDVFALRLAALDIR